MEWVEEPERLASWLEGGRRIAVHDVDGSSVDVEIVSPPAPGRPASMESAWMLRLERAPEATTWARADRGPDEPATEWGEDEREWLYRFALLRSAVEDPPGTRARPTREVSSIPRPDCEPGGLTWDGERLWHGDGLRSRIYRIGPDGSPDRQLPFDGDPTGLAWDGRYLWMGDAYSGRIKRIDPRTAVVVGIVGGGRADAQVTGVAWDGRSLWHGSVGDDGGRIFRLDPRSGEVISRLPASPRVSGLEWRGGELWYGDYDRSIVHRADAETGEIRARYAVRGRTTGIAWAGPDLWAGDERWRRICKIEIPS